jgi:perosamine synthetase
MPKIPMSSPDISAEEIAEVTRVLGTPSLSMGPYIKAFENAFANFIGVDHAVGVSSGTAGLHLCVIGAGVAPGDYVITTPFSFIASANCILYEKGIPVFVDVDPHTGNIDPALVEEALDGIVRRDKALLKRIPSPGAGNGHPGRVKAILPVHAYGQPADMGPIIRAARKYEISVIEDACESLGATYKAKNAGSIGNYGVFAFYPNKQITTAEGGMIVCQDERSAKLFQSLRNQGRDNFNSWLNHDRLGFNYRMDEIRAALGLVQLKRVEELLQNRERVASWYNERLRGVELVQVPNIAPGTTRMSWFVYVVRILPPADRNAVMEALETKGIPGRPYFTPIHLQSYYMDTFGYRRGDFPVSEHLGDISLALPFSGVMTESQVDEVCSALREILKKSPALQKTVVPSKPVPRLQALPEKKKSSLRSFAWERRRFAGKAFSRFFPKNVARFVVDAAVVAASLGLSYLLRFDRHIPPTYLKQLQFVWPFFVALYLLSNYSFRIYRTIWRFISPRDATQLGFSVAVASGIAVLSRYILPAPHGSSVPSGVLLMHTVLTYAGFLGVRFLSRLLSTYHTPRFLSREIRNAPVKRILLVGAGGCAWMIVGELRSRTNVDIVGFLDDDPDKKRTRIYNIPVLGSIRDLRRIVSRYRVDEVIVTMPSAPKEVVRRVVADCEAVPVRVSAVPDVTEIALGRLKIDQLKPIRLEDLLGRSRIVFNGGSEDLRECYAGKRILITGGAGSIGSELVRQMARLKPERLLMLDKDENSLYEMGLQIREEYNGELVQLVANVRDRGRMQRIFDEYRPHVVFHAAAYKHVSMMELEPCEAVLNNIIGSRNVIELSEKFHADRFVMISTDKAVNPTSVMGATKRVAEMIVRRQALQNGTTRFCCVRFGNVLGSRASVVPLFERRIAEKKNIQVTHPEVKRYFMTIPEAVQLVIKAGTLGMEGETFALDMGDPIKIIDLAREMIERAGLVFGKDISIDITGLRPGEKLFEEVFNSKEQEYRSTRFPKIFVTRPTEINFLQLDAQLHKLETAAQQGVREDVYQILGSMDLSYTRASNSENCLAQLCIPGGLKPVGLYGAPDLAQDHRREIRPGQNQKH